MPGERLTSEFIAGSVGTNPVVIRRRLASLREAGLVESKGARGGGWTLGPDPARITLKMVRASLGVEAKFRMHSNDPHPRCLVGQNVRGVLEDVYEEADRAVMRSLEEWTIADMLKRVRRTSHSNR